MKAHLLKDMPIVSIQTFSVIVGHQQIITAKKFFERVEIDVDCLHASNDERSYLSLTLETSDNGPVTFKSEVESLGNWTVIKVLLKDLMGCL